MAHYDYTGSWIHPGMWTECPECYGADSEDDDVEQVMTDYFQTPEFRLRHARQHLAGIRDLLNLLEKEGWEVKDGEFSLSAADSVRFWHIGKKDMAGLPDSLVVSYDNVSNEWRTDTP